jgi:hypothetical protein
MYACMYAHMHMLVQPVRLDAEFVKQSVTIIVLEIWNVIICEQLCFCMFLCTGVKLGYLYVGRKIVLMCMSECKRVGGGVNRRVEKIT